MTGITNFELLEIFPISLSVSYKWLFSHQTTSRIVLDVDKFPWHENLIFFYQEYSAEKHFLNSSNVSFSKTYTYSLKKRFCFKMNLWFQWFTDNIGGK